MFAVFFAALLWGIPGAFMGVPLAIAVLTILEQYPSTTWISELLSGTQAFFDMLGVFAEFETNLRRERQAEGIAKARRSGTYTGGKRRIERDVVCRLSAEGHGPSEIGRQLRISRRQVYRILDEASTKSGSP